MIRKSLPLLLGIVIIISVSGFTHYKISSRNTDLPIGFNSLFAGSGECLLCHENITDNSGNPIGILSDWRSSMMANAAKDPLWMAKVMHEGLVNPSLIGAIEDKCTRCHAPGGNYNAHHIGMNNYSMTDLANDSIGPDGVNCTACHQITPASLGNESGEFLIGEQFKIWGPFANPTFMPMYNHTGYYATYSNHIEDSRLCASCHSLVTHSVDYNGNPTGNSFYEQTIYQEWKNSSYNNNSSCQSCHIPRISDQIVISSMPPWLTTQRTPYGKHQLVGGNVFMQRLLKANTPEMNVTADAVHFDSTIARTTRMLQNQSLVATLSEINRTSDTLYLDLELVNMTGHKIPGGFPSRRMFVEVIATAQNGDTLFHSGETDAGFNLIQEDTGYESHYNKITDENQVQIYEMVMSDHTGTQTTVLLYADSLLKDNRIVPQGFSKSHNSYDTTYISGLANVDGDFNYDNGVEGSGSDVVHYHIPLNGYGQAVDCFARVYYQTVNDKWLSEVFSYQGAAIDTFKAMYQGAQKDPVMLSQSGLVSQATSIDDMPGFHPIIYPNPTNDIVYIDMGGIKLQQVNCYDLSGKLLSQHFADNRTTGRHQFGMNGSKGLVVLEVIGGGGRYFEKIIVKGN